MNAIQARHVIELVGDTPSAIAGVRRLAVALAVGGKLGVDPATDIANLFVGLQGQAASRPSRAGVPSDDFPGILGTPDRFIRLGAVAAIEKGRTGIQAAVPGAYPLVVTAEQRLTCDHFDFEGEAAIVPLVSSAGHGKASIQRLHYQEGRFALGTILAAIFPRRPELLSPRFLFEYLSTFKDELLVSRMLGTANVTLTIGKLSDVPVPLVSAAAQAQVDKLMVLCDQLEASREAREAVRDRLTTASLARLSIPDPETFPDAARFVLDALPALTTRPDQIKRLRQTILNLAVRGKLVPQDPNDEPASVSLNRRHISRLVTDPFEIPKSWSWVQVGAVAQARLGKMLDKAKNKGTPRPYLRNINVRWFDFNLSDVLLMPFEDSELDEFSLRAGDVLICEGGEPGRAAVWDERNKGIFFQKAIHRVRFSELVDPNFFTKALKASADDGRLAESFTGTGIKHFTGRGLDGFHFPLPPLAEQHRIVAKVDELMALCDRLEARLGDCAKSRSRLLEALLAEALAAPESAAA